jgi:hypothetical protein
MAVSVLAMIVVKRLAALGVAVGLIAGALFARDRWIEGDDTSDADARTARTLVCATELANICNEVAGSFPEVTIRAANVGDSLTDLGDDEMWFTFTPFPEIITQTRERSRQTERVYATQPVASSNVVLVAFPDRTATLTATCGDPVAWRCLGEQAGTNWSDIGGDASWRDVRPAFAPLSSGIGRLGVASAVTGFFGDAPIDANDPSFTSWARPLARAVPTTALSSGTAIATIEVRPSSLDVAVGAASELSANGAGRFAVTPVSNDTRVDLVVATPAGVDAPSRLAAELTTAALAAGWLPPGSPGAAGEPPDANTVVVTSQVWEDLT